VDVYLPSGTKPLVAEGQTAIAGETVIADRKLYDNDGDGGFRVD
jgi:phosphatidylserine decarboxylase